MTHSSTPTSDKPQMPDQLAEIADLRLHNVAMHKHIVRLEKRNRDLTDALLMLLNNCRTNLDDVDRVVQPLAEELTY